MGEWTYWFISIKSAVFFSCLFFFLFQVEVFIIPLVYYRKLLQNSSAVVENVLKAYSRKNNELDKKL